MRSTKRTIRLGQGRERAPRAFTLVEMLVSLAVLVVALSVITVVFTTTTRTTREAAAYADSLAWVRQFMDQIEADLAQVDPSNSILVLVGRTQPAARTQDELEARQFWRVLVGDSELAGGYEPRFDRFPNDQYSDPRADILMFITNRAHVSQAPPPNPDPFSAAGEAALRGAPFSPIRVIYGHAALGMESLVNDEYIFADDLRHITDRISAQAYEFSTLPLTQWHLARQVAALLPPPTSTWTNSHVLTDRARNNLVRCMPYQEGARSMPGDGAYLDYPFVMRLLTSTYWEPQHPARFSPYPNAVAPYWQNNWDPRLQRIISSLLYSAQHEAEQHVATVIENPHAELASNLGVHMLPGCAWFEVEFLMPEDPRNSIYYSPNPNWVGGPFQQRQDQPLWTSIERNQTYVFVPDTQGNREVVASQINGNGQPISGSRLLDFSMLNPTDFDNVGNRVVRMWPYAIRVTVRVFDAKGRLPEPIVRSIVHRFD